MATEGAEHAEPDAASPAAAFIRNSVVWDGVYPYWPEVNNTLDELEYFGQSVTPACRWMWRVISMTSARRSNC